MEDDKAAEKHIAEMEKRQKEISGLYGDKMKAGEMIGPDQTTLDDLKIDLGGQVYHEDGRVGKRSKSGAYDEGSAGTPLFDEDAPRLELGESLVIDGHG